MMKLEQRFLKTIGALLVLFLAALSLAACGNIALAAPINDGKLTICHATGSTVPAYETITLDFNNLTAHIDHPQDIVPAPATGCPKTVVTGNNPGKLTICHAMDNASNPYAEITVDFNGLRGHATHAGDLIPAPQTGCPAVTPTPDITTTATVTATPSGTATPSRTATPVATVSASQDSKITICHATGSSKNRYVMITISLNGLNGHDKHPRDLIPAPAGGCPK